VGQKIDLLPTPALETLKARLAASEAATYDFDLIVADKSNYDNDYALCLDLVRVNGSIAFVNMLRGGVVARPAGTSR